MSEQSHSNSQKVDVSFDPVDWHRGAVIFGYIFVAIIGSLILYGLSEVKNKTWRGIWTVFMMFLSRCCYVFNCRKSQTQVQVEPMQSV